jgi:2-amino-4-hydroxy-6-hydroxymethyldihydropteridine diphosphokinase
VIVHIGLGSNLGDREAMIRSAIDALGKLPDTRVEQASSLYETEPVGHTDQPWFLNAVARLDTELEPRQLLWNLQRIEKSLGRERRQTWGPRTIDLDLLFYGAEIIDDPGLRVPHPELLRRAFVLIPLVEIDPMLVHPETGETLVATVARLGSSPAVRRTAGI